MKPTEKPTDEMKMPSADFDQIMRQALGVPTPAAMPTQQERPDLYDMPDLGPRRTDLPPYKSSPEQEKLYESFKQKPK